jgi:WD40 repeat protein
VVIVWDAASGKKHVTFAERRSQGMVSSVAISSDGRSIVSAGADGIRFWHAATAQK